MFNSMPKISKHKTHTYRLGDHFLLICPAPKLDREYRFTTLSSCLLRDICYHRESYSGVVKQVCSRDCSLTVVWLTVCSRSIIVQAFLKYVVKLRTILITLVVFGNRKIVEWENYAWLKIKSRRGMDSWINVLLNPRISCKPLSHFHL